MIEIPTHQTVMAKFEQIKLDHKDKPETLDKARNVMRHLSLSNISPNLANKYLDVLVQNAKS